MTRRKSDPAQVKLALAIVDQIRPILAGHPPQVQGAAIAELTATLILGHAPELREMMLDVHYRAVRKMLKVYPDPWEGEGNGHSSAH